MVMDWTRATATQLVDAYALGETTPLAVVDAYLQRIRGDRLNAYLSTRPEAARQDARAALSAYASKRPGRLAGIPVALKDNLATVALPTTCASRMLAGYSSPYNATVVSRILDEGGIVLGKTNMDEFSMGSSNEYSAFGPVSNPHDRSRVPGGSSGGSAAAVADRLTCLALGSDTGGSVRQPAAMCGCVGFKPTYGHVSRYGLVAFASSLDQIGPLARTVGDCALLYDVIAGPDPHDGTATREPVPSAVEAVRNPPQRLRLGMLAGAQEAGLSKQVAQAYERVVELCRKRGHEVEEVRLPHIQLGTATYYVIANAEASANLARFDGVKFGRRTDLSLDLPRLYARTRGEGFGPEVKRRIMLGTWVLSSGYYDAYYLRAVRVRNLIRREFDNAFRRVDLLLSPTSPEPAWPLGQKRHDPLAMYLSDVFTVTGNLAGLPVVSMPVGQTEEGLPIGMQLWGRPHADAWLLSAAARLESEIGYDPHSA